MTTKITSSNIDATIATTTSVNTAVAPVETNTFNISLLGFKMAVNEGLTVFNLVDGVVDEFNDESGTDEAEGSNDLYCGTSDYYINSTAPGGVTFCAAVSAGFSTTSITEPDTSSTQTNPTQGTGTAGTFTVPCGMSTMTARLWGSGGGSTGNQGGGGGFVTGNITVTGGQVIEVTVGEGGVGSDGSIEAAFGGSSHGSASDFPVPDYPASGDAAGAPHGYDNDFQGGGGLEDSSSNSGGGGGLSGIIMNNTNIWPDGAPAIPAVGFIAGSGGGAGANYTGGAGGGLLGDAGGTVSEQTDGRNAHGGFPTGGGSGGGGSQSQGGGSGDWAGSPTENGPGGALFSGGFGGGPGGAGGAGYYGGGGASQGPQVSNTSFGGGGGSSYYGHPQVTCGSTEEGAYGEGGGRGDPNAVACTNEGGATPSGNGEDGYVLLTGSYSVCATTTSTTIVSNSFTSSSVATTSRIVVFEENVETPTLNTDIIASVSRDAGVTFTAATLSDSGYVTGSSGQRILTGQADISGQPSGQSMRWKLALANNAVKIHGVSLQWS
jgi:hypothetical protein